MRTRLSREDLLHRPASEDEIFLARHLLDKQIVDINGVKVVRVNDLKLDVLSGDLVLTAADVGVRGLVRRVFGAGITPRGGRLSDASLPARLIPWDSMQPLHPQLDRLETTLPQEKLRRLHPADIADILSQVSGTERTDIFQKLDVETAAETLHELEPEMQAEIIEDLPETHASEILEQMPADEAADVLGEIEGEHARDLVQLMEKEAAEEVTELLVHDENTAGGLMGTDFVTLPSHLTVRETLQRLRPIARDAEVLFYFYVVDEREQPPRRALGARAPRGRRRHGAREGHDDTGAERDARRLGRRGRRDDVEVRPPRAARHRPGGSPRGHHHDRRRRRPTPEPPTRHRRRLR